MREGKRGSFEGLEERLRLPGVRRGEEAKNG
jgi:hypothetical protein